MITLSRRVFNRLCRRAEWSSGSGPFAVLAHCNVLTITCHSTIDAKQ